MVVLILLVELLVLFLISRRVTELLYGLFLLLSRHRSVAISITTILFFPGTVIHELAHLFTAEVLGVRTGKLSLVPENLEEEEITAGSVQIGRSDPFRRYIIGFAPLFVGLLVLTAISYFERDIVPTLQGTPVQLALVYTASYYLLFVVSNSMFSSREDLKGFIGFAIAIGLMIGAAYVAGIRIGLTDPAIMFLQRIADSLVRSTGFVLAINVIILLTVHVLLEIAGKLLHRRLLSFRA